MNAIRVPAATAVASAAGGVPVAVARLKHELGRRNIDLVYCPDGAAAVAYLLSRIPAGATVMNGGSTTLERIGFLDALKDGPYDWLRPRVKAVNDPEERTRASPRATMDEYLRGGINKIVPDIAAAFERLRNVAAVQECRSLGMNTPCALTGHCDNAACRGPDRQCGKVLVIENEKIPGRICVVMIGAALGY